MSENEFVTSFFAVLAIPAYFAGMWWGRRQTKYDVQKCEEDSLAFFVEQSDNPQRTREAYYRVTEISKEEAEKLFDAYVRQPIGDR